MKRLFRVLCIVLLFFLCCWARLCVEATAAPAPSPIPAFPGAEGPGKWVPGGRGGDVYRVTTLEDSGPGSLREAIESASGPRTIVFGLSGTIELKSALVIEGSDLTLAGQTAPGPGITLKDHGIKLRNARNIILRHIRIRMGDRNKPEGESPDAITADYCDGLILDHLSASWAIDGIHDIRGCRNYTIQWCILSEALHDSIHSKGPHAMCASFRAPLGNIAIHHNLFSTSRDRHPTLGGSTLDPQWIIDFRNNVVYNWSGAANVCDNAVNLVANFFRPGPETDVSALPIAMKTSLPDQGRGYMRDNHFEGRDDLNADNYAAIDFHRWIRPDTKYVFEGDIDDWRVEREFDLGSESVPTEEVHAAYENVLAQAGASLFRDAVDERVVRDVHERKGKLLDSQHEVGGWPVLEVRYGPVDSDGDGMPDEWEQGHGLDPTKPEDRNNDSDGDGYTNLEEYLNELAAGERR